MITEQVASGSWTGWTRLQLSKSRSVYFRDEKYRTAVLEEDGEGERSMRKGATSHEVSAFYTGLLIGRQEGEAYGRAHMPRP